MNWYESVGERYTVDVWLSENSYDVVRGAHCGAGVRSALRKQLGGAVMVIFSLLVACINLFGCTGYPETIRPVENFDIERYLGTWYEIARLDHGFERGLSKVTAEYALNADGTVKVVNRGYSAETNEWKQAHGKAKYADSPDVGYLTVSFFGPFYASYVVFDLSEDYEYAFVSGPNTNYLWLLSRRPEIEDSVYRHFIEKATSAGFDTSEIIKVQH